MELKVYRDPWDEHATVALLLRKVVLVSCSVSYAGFACQVKTGHCEAVLFGTYSCPERHFLILPYLALSIGRLSVALSEFLRVRPPLATNRIRLRRCRFRRRLCDLQFGGAGGHGTRYQWLGLSLEFSSL